MLDKNTLPCPQCQAAGKRSATFIVRQRIQPSATPAPVAAGVHSHAGETNVALLTCSAGHEWEHASPATCAQCDPVRLHRLVNAPPR